MHQKFSVLIKEKINKFNKTLRIPPDKSCSIRALIFASQCIGESKIVNLLESEDVLDCVAWFDFRFLLVLELQCYK